MCGANSRRKQTGKHGRALSRPGTPLTGLAKAEERIYIKREPRLLRLTETGVGTARFTPPCTATKRESHFTTPTHRTWAGVNCYLAADASSRTRAIATNRAKTIFRMASPPFPFAPCRRSGQRVAVQNAYILIPSRAQEFSIW